LVTFEEGEDIYLTPIHDNNDYTKHDLLNI